MDSVPVNFTYNFSSRFTDLSGPTTIQRDKSYRWLFKEIITISTNNKHEIMSPWVDYRRWALYAHVSKVEDNDVYFLGLSSY